MYYNGLVLAPGGAPPLRLRRSPRGGGPAWRVAFVFTIHIHFMGSGPRKASKSVANPHPLCFVVPTASHLS